MCSKCVKAVQRNHISNYSHNHSCIEKHSQTISTVSTYQPRHNNWMSEYKKQNNVPCSEKTKKGNKLFKFYSIFPFSRTCVSGYLLVSVRCSPPHHPSPLLLVLLRLLLLIFLLLVPLTPPPIPPPSPHPPPIPPHPPPLPPRPPPSPPLFSSLLRCFCCFYCWRIAHPL